MKHQLPQPLRLGGHRAKVRMDSVASANHRADNIKVRKSAKRAPAWTCAMLLGLNKPVSYDQWSSQPADSYLADRLNFGFLTWNSNFSKVRMNSVRVLASHNGGCSPTRQWLWRDVSNNGKDFECSLGRRAW